MEFDVEVVMQEDLEAQMVKVLAEKTEEMAVLMNEMDWKRKRNYQSVNDKDKELIKTCKTCPPYQRRFVRNFRKYCNQLTFEKMG